MPTTAKLPASASPAGGAAAQWGGADPDDRVWPPIPPDLNQEQIGVRWALDRDIHRVLKLASELSTLSEDLARRLGDPGVEGYMDAEYLGHLIRDLRGLGYNAGIAAGFIEGVAPPKPKRENRPISHRRPSAA